MAVSKSFDDILAEASQSITAAEVFKYGVVIGDTEYDHPYFSDAESTYYKRMKLSKYQNRYWVYKENVRVFTSGDRKGQEDCECTSFYELM